ncbi:internalin, putative [hydrothermal vent metagenome]|uniref:Internalin, putative n=1 Tax=hydrothermal vent metagenome TaxID=652676 RepID=A0A3B0T0B1_9ZZZZ
MEKPDYTFYFGGVNNGADNTFVIHRTDTYVVKVIDENDCEAIANIFMEFIDIEIPNFFTPDGYGLNDFWEPKNQEIFPEILTIIFDRYGREVYRMGLNDGGWDGIYHENELPIGDYWYVIKLRGANDDREFVGHFTLYR